MPVYEYRCDACGKDQEAIQKFSDAPLADCEICGAKGTLKKLISKSSFALKGSGWYTTDYKKSSKPSETAEAAPASSGTPGDAAPAAAKAASTVAPTPAPAATSVVTPKKSTESQ